MTVNATMAIVVEKTFYERKVLAKETRVTTREAYEKSVASFASAVTKIARERMNISGLSIDVFHDIEANLARDYTILLSIASCSTTWNLFHRAKAEKLVHLAINDCPRLPIDESVSIPLVDPGDELPQVFYDLRISKKLKWSRAIIIYDDAFGSDIIGRVIKAFSQEVPDATINLASNSLFSIRRESSDTITKRKIKQVLATLPPRQSIDDRFLIISSHEMIPHIVEAARSLRMLHPENQWLFVVPDIPNYSYGNISFLIDYLNEGENIAFLYNDTSPSLQQNSSCRNGAVCHARELIGALGIALEKALMKEIDFYDRVTEEEYEATGLNKLVRSKNIITYMRDELYNNTKLYKDRGSTCGRCIRWVIASALTWGNEIGPANDNEPHKLEQTGVWTPDPGFEFTDHLFPHAIHGFLGKTLSIATYHNPPWQFLMTKTKDDENLPGVTSSKWSGLIFDVVEELANKLNFTFKTIVVDVSPEIIARKSDPMKASVSAAERIPDAITELIRAKHVFLAACAYTVENHSKDQTINFTQPITTQTYGLLVAKPKPLSRALLFTSPYSNEAWACLASAIIIVGPILYAVHTFSPRRADDEIENSHSVMLLGLGSPSRCVWYIYGALLQQGGMHLPKTDGARLIVGTWWLVVMVIVATYSGSLVAFLTFPRMEATVETVDDLLERRAEFTWTLPTGSFIEDFLTTSNSEGRIDYRQLLQEYEPNAGKHNTVTYDNNIEKVKEGNHAMIDWITSLKISSRNEQLNTGTCYFSLGTNVLLLEESISMALPRDSPYLNIINTQIKRMFEAGLIDKWIERWMPVKDQCSTSGAANRETDNHKVNLHDMQGIFFILFLGYIIGTVFLGWEFWKYQLTTARAGNEYGYDINDWRPLTPRPHRQRPVDIMVDVVNDLGIKLLDCYMERPGNIAFSPAGLAFVLAALYEGSAGRGNRQIGHILGLPRDRRITRIGLRDIHRRLRSYLNADTFLGGLTLNRDDITLRPEYEDILRFYGFDIANTTDSNDTIAINDTTTMATNLGMTTTINTDDSMTMSTPSPTTMDAAIIATTKMTEMNNITDDNQVRLMTTTDNINSSDNMQTIIPTVASVTTMSPSNQNNDAPIQSNDDNNVRKRRSIKQRRSFPIYQERPIWIDDLNGWQDYSSTFDDDDDDDIGGIPDQGSAQLNFLVHGCDVSTISTTSYTAIFPFAYFPSLRALALEFPLDDSRYNIIIFVPTEGNDSKTLNRLLATKSLRQLRESLKPTWIRATIPSFMLRGFITLTPYLQRLGITDAFEPRTADLSRMSPDLGIYARDVQQSIGVNIRNFMKDMNDTLPTMSNTKNTYSSTGNIPHASRRTALPFIADRPFLFFIVDNETSIALVAGRVDDPLNSRIN
ncbi:hypothetical protein PV326_010921 [Microctonus aethiopoides]|nr:hypothetical protein PV326_010921 [Microctonus aethiopoides]